LFKFIVDLWLGDVLLVEQSRPSLASDRGDWHKFRVTLEARIRSESSRWICRQTGPLRALTANIAQTVLFGTRGPCKPHIVLAGAGS
jgi:hypothetical protein